MRYLLSLGVVSALFSASAGAQGLTARELFYRDDAAAEAAPKSGGTKAKGPVARRKRPPAEKKGGIEIAVEKPPVVGPPRTGKPETRNAEVRTPDGSQVIRAATNFGVRYNVVQITDRSTKAHQAVDPDTRFRAGDCLAIELMSNRDGYLYVFNQASSGAWQVLLPSVEMADQPNTLRRGRTQVVPGDYCFELDDKPGTEKLLVVLTERQQDVHDLGDAIRAKPEPERGGTLLAANRPINQRIEMLRADQLIGRDIKIAKIGTTVSEGEPAHSVYAVRAAEGPDERLVLDIQLRHE
ncbi:MAG: DUF4384 domain-containing protein [Bryobacteraceae bacterium]